MTIPTLNQLKRGLEIAGQIATLESELAALLQGHSIPTPAATKNAASAPKKIKKRKMSPEGLARIRAAQKKRWSKVKTGKKAAPAPKKKKGGLTEAGRKKLAESMKARWAARKASGGGAPTQEQAAPSIAPQDLTPAVQPSVEETHPVAETVG